MKSSNNSWLVLTLLLSVYLAYPGYLGYLDCRACQDSPGWQREVVVHPLSLLAELLPLGRELVHPIHLLFLDFRSTYTLLITPPILYPLLDLHFHHPQAVTVPHLMDIYRRHLKDRQQ